MSGLFVRVVGASGNRPWTVDDKGNVFQYNGLWWEKKGDGVLDVAANAQGDVLVADRSGTVRRWNALRSEWRLIPFQGRAIRIALSPDRSSWAIDSQGRIRIFDGQNWLSLPNDFAASDLAAGNEGHVWASSRDGKLFAWQPDQRRWVPVPPPNAIPVQTVAIAPDGKPWIVLANGDLFAATQLGTPDAETEDRPEEPHAKPANAKPIKAEPVQAAPIAAAPVVPAETPIPKQATAPPVSAPASSQAGTTSAPSPSAGQANPIFIDPTEVTATGPLTFTDTRASAGRVAIGKDGSVFVLTTANDVARWSNSRMRLESFPGTLARLAVDPDGNPWGVSFLGRIFRHDGMRWKQVMGTASDIAIGADGTVITVDSAGVVRRLNADGSRFDRISGMGMQVAVDSDGTPWTIGSDGFVRDCGPSPCTRFSQKAISLAIGPDGSVFVVSDRNVLLRLDRETERFERVGLIRYTPQQVAVGPSGYPWVVTTDNRLIYSQLFPRDETGDRQLALSTSGDTVGSGDTSTVTSNVSTSGFVFTKNIQFESISGLASVFSPGDFVKLDAGNDGEIYGADSVGAIATYNSSTKLFVRLDTLFTDQSAGLEDIAVTSNGDIWAYTVTTPGTGLYRERDKVQTEFTVSGLVNSGVAVGPDDTVYGIFGSGANYYLYSKQPSSNTFKRFSSFNSLLDVGAGPGGDVWIVDRTNTVRRWNGTSFVKTPSSGQSASRIAVSANGTVYIRDLSKALRKWNGTNESFDAVNNTTVEYLTVDDNDRPWINSDNTPTIERAKN